MEVLTPAEMARADSTCGVPGPVLMANAGRAVARAIRARFKPCRAVVLCGPGNNGGDGYVVARLLHDAGWPVRVAALAPPATPDARDAAAGWHGKVHAAHWSVVDGAGLIVDALFGAGLSRPIEGDARALLDQDMPCPVVSIDLPSGICGRTGKVLGMAMEAALTVTFFRLKPGHLLLPGRELCGEVLCADIGIPAAVLEAIRPQIRLNGPSLVNRLLLNPHGNKWTRGPMAIIAGPMPGAARLAAAAARRAGASHVSVVTDRPGAFVADPGLVLHDPEDLQPLLADGRRRAWLIGPGGGEAAPAMLRAALAAGRRVVADADALRDMADLAGVELITPHEGEFERLFGRIGPDRIAAVRHAAVSSNAVVLLKGATTIIAHPFGHVALSANAPGALATAGSGDVLAGIATARMARGSSPFEAACAAAWAVGEAARRLGPGLVAEDLAPALPVLDAENPLPLLSSR